MRLLALRIEGSHLLGGSDDSDRRSGGWKGWSQDGVGGKFAVDYADCRRLNNTAYDGQIVT